MKSISIKLFISGLLFGFCAACNLIEPVQPIPGYIEIDSISLSTDYLTQGSASKRITDAWVYVDDELAGVYELPTSFPILKTGAHKVSVRGGIMVDGIAATRSAYPFYKFYETSLTIDEKKDVKINPMVQYFPGITFEWIEDFEDPGFTIDSINGSSVSMKRSGTEVFEGNASGEVDLDAGHTAFYGQSYNQWVLPRGGTQVFLELNYKSNNTFRTGIIAYTTTGDQVDTVLNINPTAGEWKKIYINITDAVSTYTNTINNRIFFAMEKAEGLDTAKLYIDNIKLIHP